jgi:hypothetical protein
MYPAMRRFFVTHDATIARMKLHTRDRAASERAHRIVGLERRPCRLKENCGADRSRDERAYRGHIVST